MPENMVVIIKEYPKVLTHEKVLANEAENIESIHAIRVQWTEKWLLEALLGIQELTKSPISIFTVGRRKITLILKVFSKNEQSGIV